MFGLGPEHALLVMALSSLASAAMIGFCLIDLVFDFLAAKGTWQAGDDYYDAILVAPHVNLGVVGSVLLMTGPLVVDHDTSSLIWMLGYSIGAGLLYLVVIIPRYIKILKHEGYEAMQSLKNWWVIVLTRLIIVTLLILNIREFLMNIPVQSCDR
mmetsp:Transcript_148729/g.414360  ORF Transcript_148729/g.414360 Transcript_148729/m.414360 type:complete len:155 (-) Transcript_148729:53-517(-)|eukprot:CAMPEP_0179012670 /NCGR_PEP_ID=MMETSP0796-20121207/1325_1 /TAXON_ID=73915 /ORGANISM="Pyrodinium bahamense, Strain pbaha01" /LENGTH=154 /DNA_ID=CAMNT_0020708139 /DNA_START=77 /DNA_END=541 /DNA_ORIENTATION=-